MCNVISITDTQKDNISNKLEDIISLLIKHDEVLMLFKSYIIYEKLRNSSEFNDIIKRVTEITKFEIEKAFGDNYIFKMDNIFEKFKDKWVKLNYELVGKLIEELVEYFGPYNKDKIKDKYVSRDVKIIDLKSEKNFDVALVDRHSIKGRESSSYIKIVPDNVEFYECKRNISNVIPNDTNHSCKFLPNLEFMREVREISNKRADIYIVTLIEKLRPTEEYLEDKGFEFIKILNLENMLYA